MTHTQLHAWCKEKSPEIDKLLVSFYEMRPDRETRVPKAKKKEFIRVHGELQAASRRLGFIVRNKTDLLKQYAEMLGGGADRSPQHGYFGTAPFSPGGAGAGAGIAAFTDLYLHAINVFKSAKAEEDYENTFTEQSYLRKMEAIRSYEKLAIRTGMLAERCKDSESESDKYFKQGLNVPIISDSWRLVQEHKYLVAE